MRVLHVIGAGSVGGGPPTCRRVADVARALPNVTHHVLVMGAGVHARDAERAGCLVHGVAPAPAGSEPLGARALGRTLTAWERADGPYDVLHAWTLGAAMALAAVRPGRAMLATPSVGPQAEVGLALLRRRAQRTPVPILVPTPAARAEFVGAGFEAEHVSVLPPGVDAGTLGETERRARVRSEWQAPDRACVIGLLTEPAEWGDARAAADVVGRVRASGRDIRLVVPPTARRRADAVRWMQDLDFGDLIFDDERLAHPWEVVAALDAAIVPSGRGNGPVDPASTEPPPYGSLRGVLVGGDRRSLPLPGVDAALWAMAAGVPVIADEASSAADVIDDGRTGFLVPAGSVAAAADRLARIIDDPTVAGRIGAAARRDVAEHFGVDRLALRLGDVWQRLVDDRPIHTDADGPERQIDVLEPSTGKWVPAGEVGETSVIVPR